MSNTKIDIKAVQLIFKKLLGNVSTKELEEIQKWLDSDPENREIYEKLSSKEQWSKREQILKEYSSQKEFEKLLLAIKNQEDNQTSKTPRSETLWFRMRRGNLFFKYISAAATVIIAAGLIFYVSSKKHKTEDLQQLESSLIMPGSEKAILTLADGSTIILDTLQEGTITSQGAALISKSNEGLVYETLQSAIELDVSPEINLIQTPKGGQYHVILPDGSKAWLNTASSIKFPTLFSQDYREVEITGEVYFEIAKAYKSNLKEKTPFVVLFDQMEVEVLGTKFNINAYNDNNIIKTTLIEGSIKASLLKTGESILLEPGQQLSLKDKERISVEEVNVNEIVAWQKGFFYFNNTRLETIMNKISRWYNVEIEYNLENKSLEFTGIVSRKENIESILEIMERTGVVYFKIEGRRVYVTSQKNE